MEVPLAKSEDVRASPRVPESLELLDGDVDAVLTESAQRFLHAVLQHEGPYPGQVIARHVEQ